jgi:threonine/homoserine/homoserine lactone efflux protein
MRGIAIGLAVAIPVGPIALLCMRRTLERGFMVGFATGFGAAVADLFYSSLAAFGISAVESILLEYRTALSFVGGIFLLFLAAHTATAKSPSMDDPESQALRAVRQKSRNVVSAAVSGFILTLTNPLTVLGFVAIFAGFGVGQGLTDIGRAIALVLGVLGGSILWWMILTAIVARVRHFFEPRTLHRLNVAAGAVIAGFGFYELAIAVMMAAPWLF